MSRVRQRVLPVQDVVQPPEQPELHVPGHDHLAPSQPSAGRRGERAQAQDDHGLFHKLHIELVNLHNRVYVICHIINIMLSPRIF